MSKGLEFQFCESWESWDEVDMFCLQFNNVVLKPEIAAVVGRDTVECMCVSADKCVVQFFDEKGELESEYKFKAVLVLDSE